MLELAPAPAGYAACRRWVTAVALALLASCGGGGDSGNSGPAIEGSTESRVITSQVNGSTYPLNIYLPPASAGSRANLPVLYLLDGQTRFTSAISIAEATRTRIIVVGIGNEANRNIDYVPANTCTPSGGGNAAFLSFIRTELIPLVEGTIGGAPDKRILLGHSHGGSFVFYALFAQGAGNHTFASYLASDASVGCMLPAAQGWEDAYAAANAALPVRLHVSYGPNVDNIGYSEQIRLENFTGLAMRVQSYGGGHIGMIPEAFTDAIAFAVATTP